MSTLNKIEKQKKSMLSAIREQVSATEGKELYPVGAKKPQPLPEKSLISKIGTAVKDVAKEVVSSAVTIPARIPQAAASLAGASNEDINRVSSKLSGGLIAPVPESGADVMKDVGRAVETAAFAIPGSTAVKLGVGGAVSGLGASVRQGNDVFSKETAMQTALGGGFGYGLGKILPKIVPKFSNKVAKTETEIAEEVAPKIEEAQKTITAKFGEEHKIPITTYGKGEVVIPKASPRKLTVREAGESLGKQGFSMPQYGKIMSELSEKFPKANGLFTQQQISKVSSKYMPDLPPTFQSNAIIKDNKNFTGVLKPLRGEVTIPPPQPTTPGGILRGTQAKSVEPIPSAEQIKTGNVVEGKGITQEKEAAFQRIVKSEESVPLRERQTNAEQVRIALTERIEDIEDVVLRGREPLPGSNKGAYWSVLADEAEKRAKLGDMSLAMKISSSNAPANLARETGQTLQSFNLVAKNNIFKAINELKMKMLENKVPSSMKKDIPAFQAAEIDKFKKEYQKIMEEVASVKLTKEELTSVFNSMLC